MGGGSCGLNTFFVGSIHKIYDDTFVGLKYRRKNIFYNKEGKKSRGYIFNKRDFVQK